MQPEAFRHLVTTYYETGVGDTSLFHPQDVDFEVKFGFPAMMKAGLAAAALLAVGLVVGSGFLLKRLLG